MTFQTNLGPLRDAVRWVSACSVYTEPVEIEPTKDGYTVSCGSPYNRRRVQIEAETPSVAYHLPARVLSDWMGTQSSPMVHFDDHDGRVVLTAKGRITLPQVTPPRFPPAVRDKWFTVDASVLFQAFQAVAAHSRTGGDLNYEDSISVAPDKLMAGTRYSCAVAKLGGEPDQPIQVPRGLLKDALSGTEGPVEVSIAGSLVWIQNGNRTSQFGMQNYCVPAYDKVMAMPRSGGMECDSALLLSAVRSASVETDIITLDADDDADGSDLLSVDSYKSSKEKETISNSATEVEYQGDPLRCHINAELLSAALATMSGDVQVKWNPDKPSAPLLVTDGGSAEHSIALVRDA